MQGSALQAVVLLLICVFTWGSVFPLSQLVLNTMDGVVMAFWRAAIAVLALGAFLLLRRAKGWRLSWLRYGMLVLAGAVGVGGLNIGLFFGLKETAAINGALIMALSPLVSSLMEAAVSRRWLTKGQIFSLIVGFCGVGLVITQGTLSHLAANPGDLYCIGGMICWSLYTLATKRISHWLPILNYTWFTMLAGTVVLGLVCLLLPGASAWDQLQALSPSALSIVVYIGLFATVIGYLFWIQGVKVLGVAQASLFFNLVPVFAALISLVMGKPLSAIQGIGMLLVLTALIAPRVCALLRARMVRGRSRG